MGERRLHDWGPYYQSSDPFQGRWAPPPARERTPPRRPRGGGHDREFLVRQDEMGRQFAQELEAGGGNALSVVLPPVSWAGREARGSDRRFVLAGSPTEPLSPPSTVRWGRAPSDPWRPPPGYYDLRPPMDGRGGVWQHDERFPGEETRRSPPPLAGRGLTPPPPPRETAQGTFFHGVHNGSDARGVCWGDLPDFAVEAARAWGEKQHTRGGRGDGIGPDDASQPRGTAESRCADDRCGEVERRWSDEERDCAREPLSRDYQRYGEEYETAHIREGDGYLERRRRMELEERRREEEERRPPRRHFPDRGALERERRLEEEYRGQAPVPGDDPSLPARYWGRSRGREEEIISFVSQRRPLPEGNEPEGPEDRRGGDDGDVRSERIDTRDEALLSRDCERTGGRGRAMVDWAEMDDEVDDALSPTTFPSYDVSPSDGGGSGGRVMAAQPEGRAQGTMQRPPRNRAGESPAPDESLLHMAEVFEHPDGIDLATIQSHLQSMLRKGDALQVVKVVGGRIVAVFSTRGAAGSAIDRQGRNSLPFKLRSIRTPFGELSDLARSFPSRRPNAMNRAVMHSLGLRDPTAPRHKRSSGTRSK